MTPRAVHFDGMQADEHIVGIWRRHSSLMIATVVRTVALLLLPALIGTVLRLLGIDVILDTETSTGVIAVLGYSAFTLLMWVFFFRNWLDYYLDAFILTNERLVRIDQRGLFNRTVGTIGLDRIQDVTIETRGMIGTFLKYGDIIVQSAGEVSAFRFTRLANPEAVKTAILNEAERFTKDRAQPEKAQPVIVPPPEPTTGTPS